MDSDKMKEIIDRAKHKNSYHGIYEEYHDDILEYLSSRFPNLPKHEVMETAVYATNRMLIAMSDTIAENNRQWEAHNKKVERHNRTVEMRMRNGQRKHENSEV